jgi:hypothetical protein
MELWAVYRSPAPYRTILFDFQRRGGEHLKFHVHKPAAAPLKNKKEDIIGTFFL